MNGNRLSLVILLITIAVLHSVAPSPCASELPDYYIYQGQPIKMSLDHERLSIRYRAGATDSERSGGFLKSRPDLAAEIVIDLIDFQMIDLDQTMANAIDANQRIESLNGMSQVEFVSPVFIGSHGGWMIVTPDILVRVESAYLDQADDIIAELTDGMEVRVRNFAGMPGAYYLKSGLENGFDVLRLTNSISYDPRIKWAEPDMTCEAFLGIDEASMEIPTDSGPINRVNLTPNDPYYYAQWWLKNTGQLNGVPGVDIDAERAWDITTGNSDIKILIMDDGVQQDHPDISQLPGKDFTVDSTGNPFGGPVLDCDRHGTSVAGMAAAITNNGVGVAGPASGCKVISARIYRSTEECSSSVYYTFSSLAAALAWGEAQGVRITNASFHVGAHNSTTDMYNSTYANGMVHFAAAGNDGLLQANYPSYLSTVNAISAIGPDGNLAGFSNYGNHIVVSAPGVSVLTTDRTAPYGYNSGGGLTYFGGTSAATPCVCGVAALILSEEPGLTPAEVTEKLKCSARDLGEVGFDVYFGHGLVNAYKAVIAPVGTDTDSDGIDDACDNCPDYANSDQSDIDRDHIGDLCDPCNDPDGDDYGSPGYPTITCEIDNCPDISNPGQEDTNSDGIGDACCCAGIHGNANGDLGENTNISDITYLVDYLFGVPLGPLPPCPSEGNANGDTSGDVNISDITYLVDYLFGVPLGESPPACP